MVGSTWSVAGSIGTRAAGPPPVPPPVGTQTVRAPTAMESEVPAPAPAALPGPAGNLSSSFPVRSSMCETTPMVWAQTPRSPTARRGLPGSTSVSIALVATVSTLPVPGSSCTTDPSGNAAGREVLDAAVGAGGELAGEGVPLLDTSIAATTTTRAIPAAAAIAMVLLERVD